MRRLTRCALALALASVCTACSSSSSTSDAGDAGDGSGGDGGAVDGGADGAPTDAGLDGEAGSDAGEDAMAGDAMPDGNGPGPFSVRTGTTVSGGGGTVRSSAHTATLIVGSPMPSGRGVSSEHRVVLGTELILRGVER